MATLRGARHTPTLPVRSLSSADLALSPGRRLEELLHHLTSEQMGHPGGVYGWCVTAAPHPCSTHWPHLGSCLCDLAGRRFLPRHMVTTRPP